MLVLELVGFTVVGFRPVNLLARAWPILVAVAAPAGVWRLLVNKTGAVLLDFGLNTITEGSLAAAFSMMIRSLAMILPTFAFVLSTDPTDLGDSLAQTFRLPARFVLAALAALRLVGILFGEWKYAGAGTACTWAGRGSGPARAHQNRCRAGLRAHGTGNSPWFAPCGHNGGAWFWHRQTFLGPRARLFPA